MDYTERKFINYIGKYAFGEKHLKIYDNINYKEINLNEILELSKVHNVDSIIYSSLVKENSLHKFNNLKIENLLKRRKIAELKDKEFLDYFFLISNKLKDKNIPFISLRGILEKKLYPIPKHRIINEVEILINKEDLTLVKEILYTFGYSFKYSSDGSNLKFTHDKYYSIVVHTYFFNLSSNMSVINKLQKEIWSHSMENNFYDLKSMSLSYDDMLLYLSINMSKHLKTNSITILDICDFALLSSKIENNINWDSFFIKASICEIEKFLLVLFIISNKFFNIKIPKEYNITEVSNRRYINSLISQILHPKLSDDIIDEITVDKLKETSFKHSLYNLLKRNSSNTSPNQIMNWLDLH